MPDQPAWKTEYLSEIARARSARQKGNEGMARVCARRAMGAFLGEYLTGHGITQPGPSAYDRLQIFSSLPHLTPRQRESAARFLLRVTPNHALPCDVDLIAEAEWLVSELTKD